MIDFHTHILPGVDDGSASVAESLAMLREEARQGVREVVLSPHFYPEHTSPDRFLEKRQRAWETLMPALEEGLPKLHLGAEIQYFEGISRAEKLGKLTIQGSRILLLEMPFCPWTERMVNEIHALQAKGEVQVMLAHIDRYLHMIHKGLVDRFLEDGILIQANLDFLTHWSARRKALTMLRQGQIHALGSDCHNMNNRAPRWDRLPSRYHYDLEDLGANLLLSYSNSEQYFMK